MNEDENHEHRIKVMTFKIPRLNSHQPPSPSPFPDHNHNQESAHLNPLQRQRSPLPSRLSIIIIIMPQCLARKLHGSVHRFRGEQRKLLLPRPRVALSSRGDTALRPFRWRRAPNGPFVELLNPRLPCYVFAWVTLVSVLPLL